MADPEDLTITARWEWPAPVSVSNYPRLSDLVRPGPWAPCDICGDPTRVVRKAGGRRVHLLCYATEWATTHRNGRDRAANVYRPRQNPHLTRDIAYKRTHNVTTPDPLDPC